MHEFKPKHTFFLTNFSLRYNTGCFTWIQMANKNNTSNETFQLGASENTQVWNKWKMGHNISTKTLNVRRTNPVDQSQHVFPCVKAFITCSLLKVERVKQTWCNVELDPQWFPQSHYFTANFCELVAKIYLKIIPWLRAGTSAYVCLNWLLYRLSSITWNSKIMSWISQQKVGTVE